MRTWSATHTLWNFIGNTKRCNEKSGPSWCPGTLRAVLNLPFQLSNDRTQPLCPFSLPSGKSFRGKTKDYNSCNREEHLTLCGPWTWLSLSNGAQGSLVGPCSGWLRMMQSPLKQSPGIVPDDHWGAWSAKAIVNRTTSWLWVWGLNCSLFHWDGVVPRSTSSRSALWRCRLFCSLLGGHCSHFLLGKWNCFPPGDTWAVRALCDVYLGWQSLQVDTSSNILHWFSEISTTESDYCASACFVLGWFLHRIYGQLTSHEYPCGKRMCTRINVMLVRYLAHEIVFS